MSGNVLHIDIVSDVICPWCFIGKRNLETALAEVASGYEVRIRWFPFQLDPAVPAEGVNRGAYFERKFGSMRVVETAFNRVKQMGAQAGIDFQLDIIPNMINTLGLHMLLHAAGREGFQHELQEVLFRAYFTEGRDLTKPTVLAELLAPWGWYEARIGAILADEALREEVQAHIRHAQSQGVSAVPFFVFNQLVSFSGAHSPEVFREIIAEATAAAGGEACDTENEDC